MKVRGVSPDHAGPADVVEKPAPLRAISAFGDPAGSLQRPMGMVWRAARTEFGLVYLVGGWLLLIVTPLLVLDRLEIV